MFLYKHSPARNRMHWDMLHASSCIDMLGMYWTIMCYNLSRYQGNKYSLDKCFLYIDKIRHKINISSILFSFSIYVVNIRVHDRY